MPGGASCAVASCPNTYYKTKHLKGDNYVGFLRFPKDPELRKLWVNACQRKDKFNPVNAQICSAHFSKEDIVRNLKAEMGLAKTKMFLKKGAVPSINLGSGPRRDKPNRGRRKVAKTWLISVDPETSEPMDNLNSEDDEPQEEPDYKTLYFNLQEAYRDLQENFEALKRTTHQQANKVEEEIRNILLTCLKDKEAKKLNKAKKPSKNTYQLSENELLMDT